MKKQNIFQKYFPYITAVIIFILISFIFLNPVLEGKKMKQSDITIYKGMSKELVDFRKETGEEALWTNGMFGGMPAYQISTRYPNNWIKKVDKIIKLGLPHPVNLLFLYFLGFFILLVILKVDPWLAIIGSFAFAFSSYFIIIFEAGHNSKAHAIAYMAPLIGSIILTYRGKYLLGGALTALFAALEISTNHLQITYYLLILIVTMGIFILFDHIKRKALPNFFKASAILLVAALLAILPNITNLWVTSEYSAQSMRGKSELVKDGVQSSGLSSEYATQWSYGIGESWSLLFPNAKGGGSGALAANKKAMEEVDPQYRQVFAENRISSYWGDQPITAGPTYAGAIMVFLFILGLFYVKGWLKWALLAGTIISITLAWGKNFMPLTSFFLDYFPLYNKFRAVSMILIIAEFTIPFLGILAIWEIIKNPEIIKEKKREFFIAFGLTGGLLLLFYILPTVFFNFLSHMEEQQIGNNPQYADFIFNMEAARISIFKADAIRSFIYITLMAATLYIYSLKKFNKNLLLVIFAVLLLADMFTIDRRYVNKDSFDKKKRVDNPYTPSVADKAILKDNSLDYRVLNLGGTFQDGRTSYYHKSIGGYHSAKLGRYQDLIDFRLSEEIADLIATLQNSGNLASVNTKLQDLNTINMLNTKYIIFNQQAQPIINPFANGNAWFVNEIKWVENANEELDALKDTDLKTTAIIDSRYKDDAKYTNSSSLVGSSIKLKDYRPNHLIYESHSTTENLAVFSEIFYDKGWNAYIDGEAKTYFRVNYTLRGMMIPEGKHVIEYKFEPKSYYTGETIALIGSILLILVFLVIAGREIKLVLKEAKSE